MSENWMQVVQKLSLNLEHPNPENLLQLACLALGKPMSNDLFDHVNGDIDAIIKLIIEAGGKQLDFMSHARQYQIFTWDWATINVAKNHGRKDDWYFKILDASEGFVHIKWFVENILPVLSKVVESHGEVYALMNVDGNLDLMELGTFDEGLARANYTDDVLAGYDHAVKCMESKKPCGRICLLNGPPGTGKSYMIRAIINQVNATHVIVPGTLVTQLASPMFLSIMQQAHQKGRPTTLIIEDADMVVVDRKAGNLQVLTDILNLGDGLLGHMLDIRVVASTNAKKIELDEAITRPGRLCRHIVLDGLKPRQAAAIYTDLTKNVFPSSRKQNWKLAEIYRLAMQDGWEPAEEVVANGGSGGNYA